jgi:D-alanyl-D-alanine carboxypeptidase/D-alanyl-D-alanine-endopeptidase (penicillin-binding protein 4)
MKLRMGTVGLLIACVLAVTPRPVFAVDRTVGATVPKPPASGGPWSDAARASLVSDIDAALDGAPTLRGAHVALLAVDARTGASVYARHPDDPLVPASTLKLLTGSVALETLGPAFRFHTEAAGFWPIVNGRLVGGLFVTGNGDVQLDDGVVQEFASAIAGAGIREVAMTGAYANVPLYPAGWLWDDLAYDFAAPVRSVGFDHNRIHLHITPGVRVGAPITVHAGPENFLCDFADSCEKRFGFRIVSTVARTGPSGSPSTIDLKPGEPHEIVVTGSLAIDGQPEDIDAAIAFPEILLYKAMEHALASANVTVSSYDINSTGAKHVYWSHDSEPLPDLLADIWLPSDNLMAEQLLRVLGKTPDAALASEMTWLQTIGVDPATVDIRDGSGLSIYDRMPARALTAILMHDWNGPYHDIVLDDLPIAGVRGTLESAFKGTRAEGRVFAKTGSMTHVNNLAGYIATQCHGTLAFAFLVDDWLGTSADLRDVRAQVLTRLIDAPC